jgi:hypothetical protein
MLSSPRHTTVGSSTGEGKQKGGTSFAEMTGMVGCRHEGWKDALRFLGRLDEWVRVFL